jgi:hypothetical protein
MPIERGYVRNFETLIRAAKNGDLALLDTQDKETGKRVIAVVAVGRNGEQYEMSPLAKMFDGDPYEELNPPDPSGGYHGTEKP